LFGGIDIMYDFDQPFYILPANSDAFPCYPNCGAVFVGVLSARFEQKSFEPVALSNNLFAKHQ
jgi:hypothetical protein